MKSVVSGLLNKQAGFELSTNEITVKAHRGQPELFSAEFRAALDRYASPRGQTDFPP